ncbi:MAG: hypothetical protein ACRDX8_05270 [Acidimicrobiales bacterium]
MRLSRALPVIASASALATLALGACGATPTATAGSRGGTATTTPTTTSIATTTTMSGMSGSNMSGTNSLPKTGAKVASVTLTGTIAAPQVTVKGTGFGSRPAPNPASAPQGQAGCPSAPEAGDGYLYGNKLFFKDPNTKSGFIAGENAGGQFDCVGLVVDSWSPTALVFGFGNLYDKHIPMNYYVLAKGDSCTVYVQGAAGTVTVKLPA